MMRGLCEMSVKHQEDLIEIGKEVMLRENMHGLKNQVLKSNVIPFRPRKNNGKKHTLSPDLRGKTWFSVFRNLDLCLLILT